MLQIIRELSKLCMFIVLWAFPMLLAHWNGNNHFLWFFILSVISTIGVFSHYEDLSRIDKLKDNEEEDE